MNSSHHCVYQLLRQLWSLRSIATHIVFNSCLFSLSRSSHDKNSKLMTKCGEPSGIKWSANQRFALDPSQSSTPPTIRQPRICFGSVGINSSDDPSGKDPSRQHPPNPSSEAHRYTITRTFGSSSVASSKDCNEGNQVWERVTTLNFGLLMVAECHTHSTNCWTLTALWRWVCWCSVRTLGISYAASNEAQDRYLGRLECEPGVVAARGAVLGPSTALV